MTPTQLRDHLASVGWSLRSLAQMLGCDDRLVRRWGSGDAEIPEPVATWLDKVCPRLAFLRSQEADLMRQHPVPEWRTRAVPTAG